MEKKSFERSLSVIQAAHYLDVTPTAVRLAIKENRLAGFKKNNKLCISLSALEEYKLNKYNPLNKRVNGEKIFDPAQGVCTVQCARKMIQQQLNIEIANNSLYYMLRIGVIPSLRKGRYWILKIEDVEKYIAGEKLVREYYKKINYTS